MPWCAEGKRPYGSPGTAPGLSPALQGCKRERARLSLKRAPGPATLPQPAALPASSLVLIRKKQAPPTPSLLGAHPGQTPGKQADHLGSTQKKRTAEYLRPESRLASSEACVLCHAEKPQREKTEKSPGVSGQISNGPSPSRSRGSAQGSCWEAAPQVRHQPASQAFVSQAVKQVSYQGGHLIYVCYKQLKELLLPLSHTQISF